MRRLSRPFISSLIQKRKLSSLELDSTENIQSRNQSLLDHVQKENFPAAERIRLHLASSHAPITPHPAYERAALANIRWPGRQDLSGFLNYLHLVPDNPNPSQKVENGPLTRTRNTLFRTGTPARNLLLVKEFSVVCAEKGYAALVWADLVRLMPTAEHPDKAVEFFLAFEGALGRYYAKYAPGEVEVVASDQRNALIALCCDAGWVDEAVRLVGESRGFRIRQACLRLIALLRAQKDVERAALVEAYMSDDIESKIPDDRAQHILTTSHRSSVAAQLKSLLPLLTSRTLVYFRPPGSTLHTLLPLLPSTRTLIALRRRAVKAADSTAYTWLVKELFYLHSARRYSELVALFGANFHTGFLPPRALALITTHLPPLDGAAEPTRHCVPKKLTITPADAWVIWNALLRLAPLLPARHALPVLESLRHSAAHYASALTHAQFYAFPTSYTAVMRSVVRGYGDLGLVDEAASAVGDISLIRRGEERAESTAALLEELARAHARAGDVSAANDILRQLEGMPGGARAAAYGVVMEGLLEAGKVMEAGAVERRVRVTYKEGDNRMVDETIKRVREMEDALDPGEVSVKLFFAL